MQTKYKCIEVSNVNKINVWARIVGEGLGGPDNVSVNGISL